MKMSNAIASVNVVRPLVEGLEPRRLLAATPTPITNFVGQYVGSLQATGGDPQSIVLSITTQKKRSFSGSFTEDNGATATVKGTVAVKGTSKFTFHSTKVKPAFNGIANVGFNSTGDILVGLFITHTGKVRTNSSFVGVKQTV